jgi:hypothetical protein
MPQRIVMDEETGAKAPVFVCGADCHGALKERASTACEIEIAVMKIR